jgi:ABC-type dipeptide/oligopeptide/nickel transport system permease component
MSTWGEGDSQHDTAAAQPPPSRTGQGQPTPGWAAYGQSQPGVSPTQLPWSPVGQPGPMQSGADGFAIASLVLGLLGFIGICAILGVVFGLVALNRIGTSGRAGRGMAIAGTVIGGVWLALTIIVVIAVSVAGAHS